MKHVKHWLKASVWYIGSSLALFLLLDFMYTKLGGYTDPYNLEKMYRIKNSYFHHTLLSNFRGKGVWGGRVYNVCTDEHGFKISCYQKGSSGNEFDIAFIGDSFTEGLGMNYEDSFVGLFAKKFPCLRVANMAVSSYSPSIYLNKIQRLLSEGVHFDHLIVFVDISDIYDEGVIYARRDDGSIFRNKVPSDNSNAVGRKLRKFINQNFSLSFYVINRLYPNDKSYIPALNNRSEWTYNPESTAYGELGVDGSIQKAVSNMEKIYDLLSAHGIQLSVGVYPWPAQLGYRLSVGVYPSAAQLGYVKGEENRQERIWREFCNNRCDMFIDAFPAFNALADKMGVEKTYKRVFIKGDVHYNESGNQIVGGVLVNNYEQIENRRTASADHSCRAVTGTESETPSRSTAESQLK